MSKYYISEGRRLARPLLDPSLLQSPNMKNQKIKYKNVKILNIMLCLVLNGYICACHTFYELSYMQKTCDVAEKAILAKKNLRKKCVNRDKM